MTKYNVTLKYPRTTRQQPYSIEIDAPSKSQAIALAKLSAHDDGWRGNVISVSVEVLE